MDHQDILQTGNIIVVDDNPKNLRLIDLALREKVGDMRLFTRALQALESAKEEAPHLFLLDVNMPQMNGYQLCQMIRKEELLKDIPVIFLSCSDASEDKIKGFESGCNDFVAKPFQHDELIARIRSHLSAYLYSVELQQKNIQLTRAMADNIAIKRKAIRYERWLAVSELTMLIADALNTPLGNALGAITIAQDLCRQSKARLDNQTLTMNKLDKDLDKLLQASMLGLENLNKTNELVDGLKLLSLNNAFGYDNTKVRDFINTVFIIFKDRHPDRQIRLCLNADIELTFVICPQVFKVILLALMENSLVYANNDQHHYLQISAKKSLDEQSLLLNYQDDGCAQEVEVMKSIFDPHSTTVINKGQKALGLHLMKHLTDRLGAVCFPDVNDKGAFEFGFKFPKPEHNLAD